MKFAFRLLFALLLGGAALPAQASDYDLLFQEGTWSVYRVNDTDGSSDYVFGTISPGKHWYGLFLTFDTHPVTGRPGLRVHLTPFYWDTAPGFVKVTVKKFDVKLDSFLALADIRSEGTVVDGPLNLHLQALLEGDHLDLYHPHAPDETVTIPLSGFETVYGQLTDMIGDPTTVITASVQ